MSNKSRLFASLRKLNIDPKMDTFSERKKIQKVVYLLDKAIGMNFNFPYNWYLHGPYSPFVTGIMFDVIDGQQTVSADPELLSKKSLKKIQQLKAFLGKSIDSNDELELLASLHFLKQRAKNSRATQQDVITFLKSKKPYFSDDEIVDALNRLNRLEDQ